MANTIITIAGDVVVFTSAHTKSDIEKVAAYKPEALMLKDEDGFVYFTLTAGAVGAIKGDQLTYNSVAPDGSGKASLTIGLPKIEGKTAKEAVASIYGPTIAKANKVEAQIDEALTEVNAMLADVEGQITIAGAAEAAEVTEG